MWFPRSIWHCQQFFSLKSIKKELRALDNLPEIPELKVFYSVLWAFDSWVLGSSMAYEKKERWPKFALMSSVQISPFHLQLMGYLCSSLKLLIKLTWYTFHFPLDPTITLERSFGFLAQATFSCQWEVKLQISWISLDVITNIQWGKKKKKENLAWEDSSRFAVKESTGLLLVGFFAVLLKPVL